MIVRPRRGLVDKEVTQCLILGGIIELEGRTHPLIQRVGCETIGFKRGRVTEQAYHERDSRRDGLERRRNRSEQTIQNTTCVGPLE